MPLITEEDKAFFTENGYIRVKNVVPKELCDRVIADLWRFLERDPSDRANWYDLPRDYVQTVGGTEIYHQQSMWDVRQHPDVYQAFREIHGEDELTVSIDRLNMTPPKREGDPNQTLGAHWDTDVTGLTPPVKKPSGRVQGVLYLDDTTEEQGGFWCVPDLYKDFDNWLEKNKDNLFAGATRPGQRRPDISGYDVKPIPGNVGDLVIWDVHLVHGNGTNYADSPRYAMYVAMNPIGNPWKSESLIEAWKNITPALPSFPGDPREWEKRHNGGPATLTPLGKQLIGLEPW